MDQSQVHGMGPLPTSVHPSRDAFVAQARPETLMPVSLPFSFDLDTAVTAFSRVRNGPFSFLLESVEGGERWARYSFLGAEPREAWRLDGDLIRRWRPGSGWGDPGKTVDPFADFQDWVRSYRPAHAEDLPSFWGGAVGYFGYDTVRWLEHLPDRPPASMELPDACFVATDRVIIVDNLRSRATAVCAVPIDGEDSDDNAARYDQAVERLHAWASRFGQPHGLEPLPVDQPPAPVHPVSHRTRADFEADVRRVQEYILSGDAYQVVISRRMETPLEADAFDVYRVLRRTNPSPYLFFMELDGVRLIGSSPETLVRVEHGRVTVRPIAGTRPRGGDAEEDSRLERELKQDEKERAEHLMLVDLGRNDVSRVARPGSVRVERFMEVERYSHVMHLVSEVTGRLDRSATAVDALRACFPAGTLTGAPKVRAMEIIDELEPVGRGPYGGAAGYVAYGADTLDMAIIIRTLVATEHLAYAQAGAGIVYDSRPAFEWEETGHKAGALLSALAQLGDP